MRTKALIFITAAFAVGLLLAAESTSSPDKKAAPSAPAKTAVASKQVKSVAPAAKADSAAPSKAAFDAAVTPLFSETCSMCHDAGTASGGLNIGLYSNVESL